MKFAPVTTLDDLDSLDNAEIVEGYASAERGDPEPGENRGRAFWHGWRCRMFDYGTLKADDGHRQLVKAWVERNRRGISLDAAKSIGLVTSTGDGSPFVIL